MKPVAIARFVGIEGPGFLADVLDRRGIPWQLIRIDEGAMPPETVAGFSGLVCMGGGMSVNDDLPWILPMLKLIRAAVAGDVPVLGHCLGGQLMARALGGRVTRNPVAEFGWSDVRVDAHETAHSWFGEMEVFQAFHWHGETFSLPPGATHLLSSRYCENQAFALGRHLAMQCHIEVTPDMVRAWCEAGADEVAAAAGPGTQTPDQMRHELEQRAAALHVVAEAVYAHWLAGLPVS